MKKRIVSVLMAALAGILFCACSKELTTSGCTVLRDDGEYVTYQTVCDHCGYEFGSPTTVGFDVFYSVNCTRCGEIIYVKIERG